MKKYLILLFGLLFISSCKENESEDLIFQEMKNYISNNVEGSYGFFECSMVKEHIDKFSWKSDLYRIQDKLYMYASQRRTILSNSYVPLTIKRGWLTPNIFQTNYEKPQGYAKKIKDSYITKEEREVCDYIYYNETVPNIQKIIKDLEDDDFHGDRICYSCGYRIASGAIAYKHFVIYKNDENNYIRKFELKYNYEMLRKFVQHTLEVNLVEKDIKALLAKYKAIENRERITTHFNILPSTISKKYEAIYRRLRNY